MSRLLYQDEEVAMADQAYGSYIDLALIQQQGCMVCYANITRKTTSHGQHGIGDRRVEWQKPKRCPEPYKMLMNLKRFHRRYQSEKCA